MRDARGEIVVNGDPCVCNRPNEAKKGYLYEQFLPQIREIITRYDPDGFWFDGDYILTRPCWCENCLREWRAATGQEAPREEASPLWGRWCEWHYRRYCEYRRQGSRDDPSGEPAGPLHEQLVLGLEPRSGPGMGRHLQR